jgi:hypothetical protein
MNHDLRPLARSAERQGVRVERGARHYKFFAPNGKDIVVIAGTASDHRAYMNNLARLKRAGYVEE